MGLRLRLPTSQCSRYGLPVLSTCRIVAAWMMVSVASACAPDRFSAGGEATRGGLRYYMWQDGGLVTIALWARQLRGDSRPALFLLLKTRDPSPSGPNWGGMNLVTEGGVDRAQLVELSDSRVWG